MDSASASTAQGLPGRNLLITDRLASRDHILQMAAAQRVGNLFVWFLLPRLFRPPRDRCDPRRHFFALCFTTQDPIRFSTAATRKKLNYFLSSFFAHWHIRCGWPLLIGRLWRFSQLSTMELLSLYRSRRATRSKCHQVYCTAIGECESFAKKVASENL